MQAFGMTDSRGRFCPRKGRNRTENGRRCYAPPSQSRHDTPGRTPPEGNRWQGAHSAGCVSGNTNPTRERGGRMPAPRVTRGNPRWRVGLVWASAARRPLTI